MESVVELVAGRKQEISEQYRNLSTFIYFELKIHKMKRIINYNINGNKLCLQNMFITQVKNIFFT